MTTDNKTQPTRAMICKRCGNEMTMSSLFWDEPADPPTDNKHEFYSCDNDCSTYSVATDWFSYDVGSCEISVYADKDYTTIDARVSGEDDEPFITLKGCIYDLTEERIAKLLVLL